MVRFSSRRRSRSRRRSSRSALATRPRMMSKSLAFKRMNQVSTRTLFFKTNGIIVSSADGNRTSEFKWDMLHNVQQFVNQADLYDQYKLLGFTVRLFPANTWNDTTGNPTPGNFSFNRGDCLVYSDQRFDPTAQVPVFINQVINTASAKIYSPYKRITRSLWRPKGKPRWGSMKEYSSVNGDDWHAVITQLINNQSPILPPVLPKQTWYYTVQFKVVFRGRIQD